MLALGNYVQWKSRASDTLTPNLIVNSSTIVAKSSIHITSSIQVDACPNALNVESMVNGETRDDDELVRYQCLVQIISECTVLTSTYIPEWIGTPVVQMSRISVINYKEYVHIKEEVGVQLNAKQADWKDDTDDESEDQELEAHYIRSGDQEQLLNLDQEVFAALVNSETKYLKKFQAELDKYNDVNYASKVEIDCAKAKGDLIFAKPEFLKKAQRANPRLYDIGCYNDNLALMLAPESDETIRLDKEKNFHLCLNEEMVADLRYFNSLEHEVDTLKSQLETQKTQFLNEIDRLSREYYYADHMNAILGVYTDLDEVTNLQCDYLETLEKCEHLEKELSKKREQYFEIQDLKAQLQDKGIAISELKKLIEKMKGKSVETKFEKSSVIRQPNAFKSQRQSILGKPATFSDSLAKTDFSKLKSVTTQNVSHDFSKPVTAQILPQNVLPIFKNTNVIAPGMYKVHTKTNQTRTHWLPQDIRKTNKRVSFSTRVIPNTSVSRPHLKINQLEDRVMSNNSQGKKQEVEDHRRNFKFSNNKTSVTACNDSLNAKTSNVNFVCVTCGKCVLNDNHDLCVLHYINGVNSRTRQPMAVPISTREPKHNVNQSVATSSKKTVATDSTVKKSRNITRKLYEQVSKTCSWWYPKYTPPGYNWKPKSQKGNVNPNVSMPLGNASRTANILEHKTPRCSTVSNTPLSSNSFAARRDNSIHRRLWVLKAHDRKSQTSN
ncbi:hypothetical protein Tco_0393015 [Tanacetum coccineum]